MASSFIYIAPPPFPGQNVGMDDCVNDAQGQSVIKLRRVTGFPDRMRSYRIILDGVLVGKVRDGQEMEIRVPTGHHQLYLAIDWARSNKLEINTDESIVYLECGSNLRGLKMLIGIIYITFLRHRYLWLKQVRAWHCRRCGYNLTGNTSGTCPECGLTFSHRIAEKHA